MTMLTTNVGLENLISSKLVTDNHRLRQHRIKPLGSLFQRPIEHIYIINQPFYHDISRLKTQLQLLMLMHLTNLAT